MKNYITKQVTKSDLNRFLDNKLNVCLVGKHGCGKTQRVKEVFDDKLKNWKYFSGSTMDPWIHLLGIPKEEDGKLKFIKPEGINEDLEGIFIDEYNRSSKEVRNALMELMQFKTMNGMKFPNLKVVWAAVNPPAEEGEEEEDDYDVEKIDPAQMDRFHVVVNIPFGPDLKYFSSKYDHKGTTIVRWWKSQPKKFQQECSPRRLECALQNLDSDIGLNFILPKTGNLKELVFDLTTDPVKKLLVEIKSNPTLEKVSDFINLGKTDKIKELFEEEDLWVFASALPKDMFSQMYKENERFMKFCNVITLSGSDKVIKNNVKEICKAHKKEKFASDFEKIEKFSLASKKDWGSFPVGKSNEVKHNTKLEQYLYNSSKQQVYMNAVSGMRALYNTANRDKFFKDLLNSLKHYNIYWDNDAYVYLNNLGSYSSASVDKNSRSSKSKNRAQLLYTVFYALSSDPAFDPVRLMPAAKDNYNKLLGDVKNNNTSTNKNNGSYINKCIREYDTVLELLNGLFS